MLAEVLDALQPAPGKLYIDGTVGGGGHAVALLQRIQPGGHVIGIDADPAALTAARERFTRSLPAHLSPLPESYTLLHGHFDEMETLAAQCRVGQVDGVLLDLGVSSHQLDTPERGFSFNAEGPLDMRLDPTRGETTADLLARLDERHLADLIYHYGEERQSRRIARAIVEQRRQHPLTTTSELSALVVECIEGKRGKRGKQQHAVARGGTRAATSVRHHGRIHPATRTFQALRIAVNGELERLEAVLPQAVGLLRPGGRLAVISFHSLEDRIVKQFFRDESGYGGSNAPARPVRLRIITRKPLVPGEEETRANPRSRSAKLRIAERTADQTKREEE